MNHSEFIAKLESLSACEEAIEWARENKWRPKTLWARCPNPAWLIWLAAKNAVDRKILVTVACLCARRALKYVPKGEDRPRIAIETAEAWVRGGATTREVRIAATAAYAAYATNAAANDAAYAAAAAAYTYAPASATSAIYAATAAAAAAYAADAADTAYAAYAADAATRKKELKIMATIVRKHIKWEDLCLK